MKIGGGPSYRGLGRLGGKSKSKKAGKSSKASSLDETSEVSEIEAAAPADPVDVVDPVFNAFEGASQEFDEEGDLEEATRAVVSSVLREHLGNKNLSEKEMKQIETAVTNSVQNDQAISKQLEGLLQKIARQRSHQKR